MWLIETFLVVVVWSLVVVVNFFVVVVVRPGLIVFNLVVGGVLGEPYSLILRIKFIKNDWIVIDANHSHKASESLVYHLRAI